MQKEIEQREHLAFATKMNKIKDNIESRSLEFELKVHFSHKLQQVIRTYLVALG